MILGVHIHIWIVITVYFVGMLGIGWWSRIRARNSEGYLVGNRRFGVFMMIMHAFGAGTNPGDAAGVISGTVRTGLSGIWVSWIWLFGTPFYWLIAPVFRRFRAITTADVYEARYDRSVAMLYACVGVFGLMVNIGLMLKGSGAVISSCFGGSVSADGIPT